MSIAIMSAMPEETAFLFEELKTNQTVKRGQREFHLGALWGEEVVLVFSRWGKVASAVTATELISQFNVSEIIFTGVAGGVDPALKVGDIVIARSLVQHDVDARPFFEEFELPLIKAKTFETDLRRRKQIQLAAEKFIAQDFSSTHGHTPRIVEGLVATGDRFFADAAQARALAQRLPGLSCVEMEGAAVGQVCFEYGVPFSVVRVISDSADGGAPADFMHFVNTVAKVYSHGLLKQLFSKGE